jgi:hypothetical protein
MTTAEERRARVGAELMFRGDAGWAFALYGREVTAQAGCAPTLQASVDSGTFRLLRQHELFGLGEGGPAASELALDPERDVSVSLCLSKAILDAEEGNDDPSVLARRLKMRCRRWTQSPLQQAQSWECVALAQVAADGSRVSWAPTPRGAVR